MNEENILIIIAGTISANSTVPVDIELQFRTVFVSLGPSFSSNKKSESKKSNQRYLAKGLPVKVHILCHVQLYLNNFNDDFYTICGLA